MATIPDNTESVTSESTGKHLRKAPFHLKGPIFWRDYGIPCSSAEMVNLHTPNPTPTTKRDHCHGL